MEFSLYILLCADGTLYTGIAAHVARRLAQHNGEKPGGARYTSGRRPVKLVYEAKFASRSAALKEELRLKRLSRTQKQHLISAYQNGCEATSEPAAT
jgi:putative endonuclease